MPRMPSIQGFTASSLSDIIVHMNIFVVNQDPVIAAQELCDKHVVKMILESAQMLSTAHRLLDGEMYTELNTRSNRRVKRWRLDDERDNIMYKVVHINHPCTVWTRECSANYKWHYRHFVALCDEFTHRYSKVHSTDKLLRGPLAELPNNIVHTKVMTKMPMAMFDECKISSDPVECYRNYYQTKQTRFNMSWTNRQVPEWFRFHDEEYVL